MTSFRLKIVTPDGLRYEGQAEDVVVRTTTGDMGILAGHISTVAPLGMGRCTVVVDGTPRYGACIGGMISVMNGVVKVVATTFEWEDEIDLDRAKAAEERARAIMTNKDATGTDIRMAEARLKRALIRQNVARG